MVSNDVLTNDEIGSMAFPWRRPEPLDQRSPEAQRICYTEPTWCAMARAKAKILAVYRGFF